MSTPSGATDAVSAEWARLSGARIQRVDRVDPRTWVFELRAPGRTLRLLIEGGPARRAHLVERRPPRRTEGGEPQRRVRKRTVGQAVLRLERTGRRLEIELERDRVIVDLGSGELTLEARSPVDPPPPPTELPDRFPANEAAAREGETSSDRDRKEALRRAAVSALRSKKKKKARLVRNIEGDVARLEAWAACRRVGELLKSGLHRVRRGDEQVSVEDWTTGTDVVIPLLPELSPTENMERLFARAKRGQRGLAVARPRLDDARQQVEALDREVRRLEALNLEALDEDTLRDHLGSAVVRESTRRTGRRAPIDQWSRRFSAKSGAEIRVGRGARENDRLTLQGARGHDRWLHLRGTTGAHVILRCEPGREPDPEDLLDAAHLALHYSEASREARADVLVAEARHVKKTKGAPPGRVGVAKSRTLHVVVEPERLRRLLAAAPDRTDDVVRAKRVATTKDPSA